MQPPCFSVCVAVANALWGSKRAYIFGQFVPPQSLSLVAIEPCFRNQVYIFTVTTTAITTATDPKKKCPKQERTGS